MDGTERAQRWRASLAIAGWLVATSAVVVMAAVLPVVRAESRVEIGDITAAAVGNGVVSLILASFGALVVLRGRDRRYGWILLGAGVTLSAMWAAEEIALHEWYVADEPAAYTDLAIWVQGHWPVFFAVVSLLLPALFPDGRPAPGLQRPVAVLIVAWTVLVVVTAFSDVVAESAFLELPDPPMNPYGFLPVPLLLLNVCWVVLTLASFGLSALSLRTRWRHADGDGRRQLGWVLLALGFVVWLIAIAMVNVVLEEVVGIDVGLGWLEPALPLSFSVVAFAIGLGVLRFRLYDVDLVVNRTLAYGAMSVLVVVAYVATVSIARNLLSIDDTAASMVATGLIAVAFAPARDRVQLAVSRRLFGRRDDPVGVLTDLGRQLERASGPEETLRSVAEMVKASMKVPGARIELPVGADERLGAKTGHVGDAGESAHEVALRHQGVEVGRLVVARRRRGEPLHADDAKLLDGLAHHAAVIAHAVGLHIDLQRSRQQLITAREEERRRLRRDLHDGLGPSLASQTFRIDAIRRRVADQPGGDVVDAALVELKDQTQELVADIRRLVHDLRPASLDDVGLVGALRTHAAKLSGGGAIHVSVDARPDPLGPLPAAVELAAFRIAGEALTNAVRHGRPRRCLVRLRREQGTLVVEVEDDGEGIAPHARPGIGLESMRQRAVELGGRFAVVGASPGTLVRAELPFAAADARLPIAEVRGRG